MSFDPAIALEDWLASPTGALSRRKLAALEEHHERTLDTLNNGMAAAVLTAPGEYCAHADLPQGSPWPVVVAAALDHASSERRLYRDRPHQIGRTLEVLDLLVDLELLEPEAADACLERLGYDSDTYREAARV